MFAAVTRDTVLGALVAGSLHRETGQGGGRRGVRQGVGMLCLTCNVKCKKRKYRVRVSSLQIH